MAKLIKYDMKARESMLTGVKTLADAVVVTLLFCSKRTSVYGYLLNGMIVIYGTVLMAHYSIDELTIKGAPLQDWVVKSTLPDIGISWADFFVGKVLYELNLRT